MPIGPSMLRFGWFFSLWSSAVVELLTSNSKIEGPGRRTLYGWREELYDLNSRSAQLLAQTQDVRMHSRLAGAVVWTSYYWDHGKRRGCAS